MSLVKILLIFASTLAAIHSATPPNPQVAHDARPKALPAWERLFSAVSKELSLTFRCLMYIGGTLESLVILADAYPKNPLSQMVLQALINGSRSLAHRINISPQFLVGAALATCGGYVRYLCYRALGRHFTFEVSILDRHQLITSGPYAYIRYPSYPAWIASIIGLAMCFTSPGSWLVECGVVNTAAGRMGIGLYAAITLYTVIGFAKRMEHEEALLKTEFGKQWDEWAMRVPYRMIPYVW
ncbi:uncharacterized protein LAESUDRAFT_718403 [Laetiporus sulphureus 93-53]|uniref:Protein-S-isoprenylcysteine O-methyltransferase n=1 Tax=Laetiporus sulphureus 93-53 TaxID=1314785 RepID=A0A165B042_9APHY|nr:uncharacterized protein LAESUDRAFT_718403 [Laetiporus sulphureus 93-53]KZS99976.1 hypothetical protein LAESUDRAFT_718403 [Laetiporus sulphureus 93-53]